MLKSLFALTVLFISTQVFGLESLKNGAPFIASRDAGLPRSTFIITFLGGPAKLLPEQQGVIPVLREVLNDGPADISEKDFKEQLFTLGAEIDYLAEPNAFEILVRTPPDQQMQTFELLKRTLANPRIGAQDFDRYKANVLAATRASFESMQKVTIYFALRDAFSDSPLLQNGDTSPASLEKLTHKDFAAGVQKLIDDRLMFVSYVGPDSPTDARKKFESAFPDRLKTKFTGWKPKPASQPSVNGFKYTIINKPGATDNQLFFLFPNEIRRDTPEWADAKVTMDLLGGGLHGMLGHTLRTLRGLTYHASSSFSQATDLPFWYVYTFGGLEQTKPLLEGVPEVIATFKKTALSTEQIKDSKERLTNDYKTQTELPKDEMRETAWYYVNGYDPSRAKQFLKNLRGTDTKRVAKLKEKLNTQNALVYLMGDREKLLTTLEATGVKRDQVRTIELPDIR